MTLEEFKTEILEPTVRRRFGDVYVDAYHVAVMAGVDLDDAIAFAKAAAANVKGNSHETR